MSPVYVAPSGNPRPFESPPENTEEEKVFCFELDAGERLAFEPDQNKLLGELVFGGEAAASGKAEIPKGNYLFAQQRKFLSKDEIIGMAADIQMEGLWQRLKPGETLYLRYLFEDGSWVTQLFRPYKRTASTM